ncbi:hypothetical protein KXD40_004371 [Peronospora effusa]|nr:hypothetical protein KXD40_004371 [Peronospora effusa]
MDSELPPVVPQDLCGCEEKGRLLALWTLEEINLIEQEHGELSIAPALKSKLDFLMEVLFLMNRGVLSKIGSSIFNLQQFCGRFATVLPGTSQVESDFSISKE